MDYTIGQLEQYAAELIGKGKSLRKALREQARDKARLEVHEFSSALQDEVIAKHVEVIQGVMATEVVVREEVLG